MFQIKWFEREITLSTVKRIYSDNEDDVFDRIIDANPIRL